MQVMNINYFANTKIIGDTDKLYRSGIFKIYPLKESAKAQTLIITIPR